MDSELQGGEFLELIAALHGGVAEETPWRDFVGRLRRTMQGNSANLIFRDAGATRDALFAVEDYATPPPSGWHERYFQEFHRDDPFPYFKMTPGTVYRLEELLGGTPPGANRFLTEFLHPLGIDDLLLFFAAEPGGGRAWVTVTRGAGDPDFSMQDVQRCRILAQQLSGALKVFAALQEERMHRQLYQHAARQLNVDFLLLDERGRLLLREGPAARVRAAGLRQAPDGRLHAHGAVHDAALQDAIAQARAGQCGQALHIGDDPFLDVFVLPLTPADPPHPPLGREMPAVVIYLHAGPIQVSSAQLEKLFGLSGTEARLAAALARGRSLTQAAVDIGVTEQTARRYSKLIFAKTGANRQAELIRRILGSGAVLAP